MYRLCMLILVSLLALNNATAKSKPQLTLTVSYIKLSSTPPATLSAWVVPPKDSGIQGAMLGVKDVNTTGKFLNKQIELKTTVFTSSQELLDSLKAQVAQGQHIFLIDSDHATLSNVQQWAKDKSILIFNVSADADELRQGLCDRNTLHTSLSVSMKSDALAQWLLSRRLTDVLVVHGRFEKDLAIVKAFERSAKRYGLNIIDKKQWAFDSDLRRSASREMPLFTQTRNEYDVVFVADDIKDFANYLPYNTYLPRPVVGAAGIEAVGWHPRIEQWGALQLQNRFTRLSNRGMNETDFASYVAIRSLSGAFFKLASSDVSLFKRYIASEEFSLAAYLGRKLSYRPWSGQLRMPVSLLHPTALVSQSPQQGILHPINELDTLGYDKGQSTCKFGKHHELQSSH